MKVILSVALFFCMSYPAHGAQDITDIETFLNHTFTNKRGESLSVDASGNALLKQAKFSIKGLLEPSHVPGVFVFQAEGRPKNSIAIAGTILTEDEGKLSESLEILGKPAKTLILIFFALDGEGRTLSLGE